MPIMGPTSKFQEGDAVFPELRPLGLMAPSAIWICSSKDTGYQGFSASVLLTLRPDTSLLYGAVLCIVGLLAPSLGLTHHVYCKEPRKMTK